MTNRRLLTGLAILAMAVEARAAGATIPKEKQIAAQRVGALESPEDDAMHMPTDVAIDSRGNVFIADGANDRIVTFTDKGDWKGTLPWTGSDVALKSPVGLGIDANDRLWVADTGNRRILICSSNGGTVEAITLPGAQADPAPEPTDVAVTSDGNRAYVIDNNRHRILICDNATGEWQSMGRFGEAVGQFRWPFMVCVGGDDYAAVTEAIGARVQRVSPKDKWAGSIGRWGIELGQLYRPKGIAIDRDGHLYVSDSTTQVVQVFNDRGVILGVLTESDGTPLRFAHPMGLAFDAQQRLHVVELRANRIAIVVIESLQRTRNNDAPAKEEGK